MRRTEYGMNQEALPKADDIVRYPDGSFAPIMFHYAAESSLIRDIAAANGFELRSEELHDDNPLAAEYEAGDGDVIRRWNPPEIDGWRLVGKNDTDDGPRAWYVRAATQ